MCCRFLRNCQTCYFKSSEGMKKQMYLSVPLGKRVELCQRFGYTCMWERQTRTTGSVPIELGEPSRKEPMGELAEVGGECFFSSVYYLLCGRKSGQYQQIRKKNLCRALDITRDEIEKKRKFINFASERKHTNASRNCKAIRVAATQAMQTDTFKEFCRASLGTAPNDFLAKECAKVTASISEAAVSGSTVFFMDMVGLQKGLI